MLLSVNFTIVFAFFSVAVNFNPSLCCLSPFLLSYTVCCYFKAICRLLEFFLIIYPIEQAIIIICTFKKTTMELDTHSKKYFLLHTREF